MPNIKSLGNRLRSLGKVATKPDNNETISGSSPDGRKTLIKVYGEINSGTHFVHRLLKRNFSYESIPGTLAEACPGYRETIEQEIKSMTSDPAKQLWIRQLKMDAYFQGNLWSTLGWKHSTPPLGAISSRPDIDNILFITVTKNPYAWALSLFRRPYDYLGVDLPKTFSKFLTEPWLTVKRDNAPALLQGPIELWNIKAKGHSQLSRFADAINYRYEDILTDPTRFLDAISKRLTKKTNQFIVETASAKQVDKGKKNFEYYQDYYLNQRWRNELSQDEIKLINQQLDKETVHEAGCEIVE